MEVLSYIYYLTKIVWRYSNVCLQIGDSLTVQ